jgi:hypothetical protein
LGSYYPEEIIERVKQSFEGKFILKSFLNYSMILSSGFDLKLKRA